MLLLLHGHGHTPLSLHPPFTPLTLPSHPRKKPNLIIRMGGGPRTFPGGVSKWQWKRMQQKKAKQLLKARLAREREMYEMRKRAELKAAVAELERPWEVLDERSERSKSLMFSVQADDQLRVLADRFQRPGGFDLWTDVDGPQLCVSSFRDYDDEDEEERDGDGGDRLFVPKGLVRISKGSRGVRSLPSGAENDGERGKVKGSLLSNGVGSREDSVVGQDVRNFTPGRGSNRFSKGQGVGGRGRGRGRVFGGDKGDLESQEVRGYASRMRGRNRFGKGQDVRGFTPSEEKGRVFNGGEEDWREGKDERRFAPRRGSNRFGNGQDVGGFNPDSRRGGFTPDNRRGGFTPDNRRGGFTPDNRRGGFRGSGRVEGFQNGRSVRERRELGEEKVWGRQDERSGRWDKEGGGFGEDDGFDRLISPARLESSRGGRNGRHSRGGYRGGRVGSGGNGSNDFSNGGSSDFMGSRRVYGETNGRGRGRGFGGSQRGGGGRGYGNRKEFQSREENGSLEGSYLSPSTRSGSGRWSGRGRGSGKLRRSNSEDVYDMNLQHDGSYSVYSSD